LRDRLPFIDQASYSITLISWVFASQVFL